MFPITQRFPCLIDWDKCKYVVCYTRGNKDSENAASIVIQHIQSKFEPIWIANMKEGVDPLEPAFECTFKHDVAIYFIGANPSSEYLCTVAECFTRIVVIDNTIESATAFAALQSLKRKGLLYDGINTTKTVFDITISFLGIGSDTYSIVTPSAYGYCCAHKITIDGKDLVVNDAITTFGGLSAYLCRKFYSKVEMPKYFRNSDALPEHFTIVVSLQTGPVLVQW